MRAVVLILLVFCFSCQSEVNSRFPIIAVSINDTNEVTISDSIYYITADTLPNKVAVVSDVSDPNIYYSVNKAAPMIGTSDPMTLQKQDTVLQFYLTKKGYDNSELKTVIFQANSAVFLNKVDVSSIVADSNLNISMSDKSRGMMKIEIISVTGKRLLQRNHLKRADTLIIKYALAEYPRGIYFVSATYGQNHKVYRFLN